MMRLRAISLLILIVLISPPVWAAEAAPDRAAREAAEVEAEAEARAGVVAVEEEPIDLEEVVADRRRKASLYQVKPRISRYLAAAAEKADEGSVEDGLALLDRLSMPRLNRQERAMVYRLRGFLAYTDGDYEGTIAAFEKVLGEEVLPLDAENKIRFNIAQLRAAAQQWDKVIPAIKRWTRYVPSPTPLSYYLLGISYYQLGQMDLAIENTEKAVDASPEPTEGWLQLLAALYVQKEDYVNATPVLEELVMRFPKKQYWNQLSLIYGARDDYRHALAVQQVAYLQGFLTEDKELRRLVRSYLYHELPYPAAKILEKGLADGRIEADASAYEMLANSLIAAREYDQSLEPLQKAAELSPDGKLLIRLGQVYLQREDWTKAAESFEQALAKGGLENPGSAELLLGISYYESQRVGRARAAFLRARGYAKARAEADSWITHLANEASKS